MWYQIDNDTSAKLTDTTTDGNSTYKYSHFKWASCCRPIWLWHILSFFLVLDHQQINSGLEARSGAMIVITVILSLAMLILLLGLLMSSSVLARLNIMYFNTIHDVCLIKQIIQTHFRDDFLFPWSLYNNSVPNVTGNYTNVYIYQLFQTEFHHIVMVYGISNKSWNLNKWLYDFFKTHK